MILQSISNKHKVFHGGEVIIEKQLFGEEFGAQLVVEKGVVKQAFFTTTR